MDNEYQKFEVLTKNFKKKVQEIAVDSKSIKSFFKFLCLGAWKYQMENKTRRF